MQGSVYPVLVLLIWVTLGLTSVLLLQRQGRRSLAWYPVGIVLGPIFLPIAVELAGMPGGLVSRTAEHVDGPGPHLTVLAAIDGSRESDEALTDAIQFLPSSGTRYVLLTVIDPDVADDDRETRQAAERLLASYAARLPVDAMPPVQLVGSGEPAQVILDCAEAERADVIVMGRRGAGFSKWLLGSIADRVVRRATIPVLLGRRDPAIDMPWSAPRQPEATGVNAVRDIA